MDILISFEFVFERNEKVRFTLVVVLAAPLKSELY